MRAAAWWSWLSACWAAAKNAASCVAAENADGAVVLVLAGAGRDGAGFVPLGAEAVARPLGVEDAPGGAVDPHPAARPAATASTTRPGSDRMVITPS